MKFKGKKRYLIPLIFVGVLGFGPRESFPALEADIPELDLSLSEVEAHVNEIEAKVTNLKPDNQARVIWADSIQQTPYSIVYLHGFSASPMEGAPIHQEVAKRYGCNLYLARIAGHGIDDPESFKGLTPNAMMESAQEAIAIGKILGEKVILMSCSTGGTLSIYLAAKNHEAIHAQILYSPNISLYNNMANILTWPWGRQLGRMIVGDSRQINYPDEDSRQYWTSQYSMDGVSALMSLLKNTMKEEVFQEVKQPLFVGYYYKNDEEQDKVVSTEAIQSFLEKVGTPEYQRKVVPFPKAGAHVITSHLRCKDLDAVRQETYDFMENMLGISPIERDISN